MACSLHPPPRIGVPSVWQALILSLSFIIIFISWKGEGLESQRPPIPPHPPCPFQLLEYQMVWYASCLSLSPPAAAAGKAGIVAG